MIGTERRREVRHLVVEEIEDFDEFAAEFPLLPQRTGSSVKVGVGSFARRQHGEKQAVEGATVELIERDSDGRLVGVQDPFVAGEPVEVVDVQKSTDSSADLVLANGGRRGDHAGSPSKFGPRVSVAVQVLEVESSFVKVGGERDVAELAKLLDALTPCRGERVADVVEDDLAGDWVERDPGAGGEVGEAGDDVAFEFSSGAAQEPSEPLVEAELLVLIADEVEDGQHVFASALAEPASELLEEDRCALGRAQHQHDIDGRDVDALVEEVDGEQDLHVAGAEVARGLTSIVTRCARGDGDGSDAGAIEPVCHEVRVVDAHAEPERPHGPRVTDLVAERFEDLRHPDIRSGVQVRQLRRVVSGPTTPGHGGEVSRVVDTEVVEGREQSLFEGIPQSQFDSDPAVEPTEDVEPVRPLRSCRETQKVRGLQVIEERGVGIGGGVVELIDDHDVELRRVDVAEVGSADRLHRREDVLPSIGPFAAEPHLSEGAVLEDVTEHVAALAQDRVAVGDEQQPRPRERCPEVPIVERCHHGLAGTGCSDDKGVGVAAQPLDLEAFEDRGLEGQRRDVERCGDGIVRTCDGDGAGEAFRVEVLVVGIGPIGGEGPLECIDEFGVDAFGGADVPLETGDLSGEREVRRADVDGREAGCPVEQPRLRMETRRGRVV